MNLTVEATILDNSFKVETGETTPTQWTRQQDGWNADSWDNAGEE